MTAEQIIATLGLVPLEPEGGYFRETYRSAALIPAEALPARAAGPRACSTAIYYLLTPDTFSAMHRVAWDEIFHFYLGDPVEMLRLFPGGAGDVVTIGTGLSAGMRPQVVVPAGAWQGARIAPGGRCALLGTTVAPGFDPADFEPGLRAPLIASHPRFRDLIAALTR